MVRTKSLAQSSRDQKGVDTRVIGPVKTQKRPEKRKCMLMTIPIQLPNKSIYELEFLVDTGSDVNLIRKGLLPSECWERPENVVTLFTANDRVMAGGDKICKAQMEFWAIPVGKEEKGGKTLKMMGEFYEGDIQVDGIICYEWLFDNDVNLFPRRGCLMIERNDPHWLYGAEIENNDDDMEEKIELEKLVQKPGPRIRTIDMIDMAELENILTAHMWVPPEISKVELHEPYFDSNVREFKVQKYEGNSCMEFET